MSEQAEQFAIPLPMKSFENRREYLTAAYNRLVSKIGAHDTTDLKDIVALSILHVQLSEVIEALARQGAEVQP